MSFVSSPTEPKDAASRLRLSQLLVALSQKAQPAGDAEASLRLADVLEHTQHAGFGFLIAFLALVAIPFVGLSTPFGLAIALLGAQMLGGRDGPWLPKRVRRHVIAVRTLDWLAKKLTRATRWLEHLVRPRWSTLVHGAGWRFVGLGIVILGMGLALPIPVPGSNWVFIAPILVYAIGLLEHDGALIAIGHTCAVGLVIASIALSHLVVAAFERVGHWVMHFFH